MLQTMDSSVGMLSDQDIEKSASSFSEHHYTQSLPPYTRTISGTPQIKAMSSLQLAMSTMMESAQNQTEMEVGVPKKGMVRAAIHYFGDLVCEFNDGLSASSKASKQSKSSGASSNLSYKEHEHESIDSEHFTAFLETKFSLFGYTTIEIRRLFLELNPQTPLNAKGDFNGPLTVHFTEFNPIIHQFYTAKFHMIFAEKSVYQQSDIYQLLLLSIKSKLQVPLHSLSIVPP